MSAAPRASTHRWRPATPRPEPHLPGNLGHLQHERIFVLWRYGTKPNRQGKYQKIPYNARTGTGAKMNDPTTWATFEECLERWRLWPNWFQGVGIVLDADATGIDKDDCITDGQLNADALDLVRKLAGVAYIERSVGYGNDSRQNGPFG
ncbi:MAG: hypothetical protein M3R24_25400 [Chloroflexota bacterium]|nr:hypothetical protein [Chloroflexota bacterium]